MAGRKSDFTLTKLDDLFTTQAQRDEEQLSKIRDIPLELIDDFPDHPFKVRDDEDMMQLVESVKERGVITPATVRQKEDGRYELVSGHRRKRACELAGFETLRSEIVDLNRDEATILMVESNFQRYGKILLDYSLEKAKGLGCRALCFEGNIDFYGKSGFRQAREFGIRYHGLPEGEDASFFLCKELIPGYLNGITGEYAPPAGYLVNEKEAEAFDREFPYMEKKKLPGQIFEGDIR